MSSEATPKAVRKGTKSCVECRQRKVRCVWPSDGGHSCLKCLARGRKCELQVHMTPTSDTVRQTSRARIGQLERNVASLWNAVQNLESKLGYNVTEVALRPTPQEHDEDDPHHPSSDEESESDQSDLSPPNPPTHLLHLFDNGLLGSYGYSPAGVPKHSPSLHKTQANLELRRLIPPKEDMVVIDSHAASWLDLYNQLFPRISGTIDGLLVQYDRVQDPSTDTPALARFLLTVALTVQQAPKDGTNQDIQSLRNADAFIKDVSEIVDRIIVNNDVLAATVEGIEVALLSIRLQLGRGRVRQMWLLSRRVIALAELCGLPRASMTLGLPQDSQPGTSSSMEQRKKKAEMWESICALDRITSSMWSLPIGTAHYPLAQRPVADAQGNVIPQALLYRLAEVAARLLDLDNISASGRPRSELFNAVMSTDQELRSLASQTPKNWWRISWPGLIVDAPLQYWYTYMVVRTHLHLALIHNESQPFHFNFVTCMEACQELCRRYATMRPLYPRGFFISGVLDLQILTAIVFLLLVSHRAMRTPGDFQQTFDVNQAISVAYEAFQTMEAAAEEGSTPFAQRAVDAIRSLRNMLQQSHTTQSQRISLNLPIVGKLHISRDADAMRPGSTQTQPTSSQPLPGFEQPSLSDGSALTTEPMSTGPSDLDSMDILSYSMEIPENLSFWTDENFGSSQWFSFNEFNGNG